VQHTNGPPLARFSDDTLERATEEALLSWQSNATLVDCGARVGYLSGSGAWLATRVAIRRAIGSTSIAMDEVTPNEIARTLNVSALTFRNWLRAEKAAGHPLGAVPDAG
jgi:hypothetical protein